MILTAYYGNGKAEGYILDSWKDAREAGLVGRDDTFFLNFSLADRDWLTAKPGMGEYQKKKHRVEYIASEYDFFIREHEIQLSWNELSIIQDWFYRNGKRYGLLEELKENAFC